MINRFRKLIWPALIIAAVSLSFADFIPVRQSPITFKRIFRSPQTQVASVTLSRYNLLRKENRLKRSWTSNSNEFEHEASGDNQNGEHGLDSSQLNLLSPSSVQSVVTSQMQTEEVTDDPDETELTSMDSVNTDLWRSSMPYPGPSTSILIVPETEVYSSGFDSFVTYVDDVSTIVPSSMLDLATSAFGSSQLFDPSGSDQQYWSSSQMSWISDSSQIEPSSTISEFYDQSSVYSQSEDTVDFTPTSLPDYDSEPATIELVSSVLIVDQTLDAGQSVDNSPISSTSVFMDMSSQIPSDSTFVVDSIQETKDFSSPDSSQETKGFSSPKARSLEDSPIPDIDSSTSYDSSMDSTSSTEATPTLPYQMTPQVSSESCFNPDCQDDQSRGVETVTELLETATMFPTGQFENTGTELPDSSQIFIESSYQTNSFIDEQSSTQLSWSESQTLTEESIDPTVSIPTSDVFTSTVYDSNTLTTEEVITSAPNVTSAIPPTPTSSVEISEASYLQNENYWIKTVIEAEPRKWSTVTWEEVPSRIARAYLHAFHRKLRPTESIDRRDKRSITRYSTGGGNQSEMLISVMLLAWSANLSDKHMDLVYTLTKDDIPVDAIEATGLLSLLSEDEVKQEIGYPIIVKALPFQKNLNASGVGRNWVILIAVGVTGASVALLICGALAYYRCCRKPDEMLVVESEQTSPSHYGRHVQRMLQEGVVSLDIRSSGEGSDDKDSKRPLPEVPGTSTETPGRESRMGRSSKRLATFLNKNAKFTQTEGVANLGFEDEENSNQQTNNNYHDKTLQRQPIKKNKGEPKDEEVTSSNSSGYFDYVPNPIEANTLPSQAPLIHQNVKERHRRKSNRIGASPPDENELKSRQEINKLVDDTLLATSQKTPTAAYCETLEGDNDCDAPRVVWTVYKAPDTKEEVPEPETGKPEVAEPLFVHSDKHPSKLDYSVRSAEPSARPLTAPDLHSNGKGAHVERPSSHQQMTKSHPEVPVVEAVRDELDMVSALRVKEPAESVIKAIKKELHKFNTSLPGSSTGTESSA